MIRLYHFLFDKLGFISLRGSEKYDTKFTTSNYYFKIYLLSFCMLCFLMVLLSWDNIKTTPNSTSITFIIFFVSLVIPFVQHIYLQYKGFAEEVFTEYEKMSEEYKKKSLRKWICKGMLPYCFFPIIVVITLCVSSL